MAQEYKLKKSKSEMAGDADQILSLLGRLGVPYAAAYLGLHPYTLRQYVKDGLIQAFFAGNRAFILKDELLRFKEHGKLNPPITPPTQFPSFRTYKDKIS